MSSTVVQQKDTRSASRGVGGRTRMLVSLGGMLIVSYPSRVIALVVRGSPLTQERQTLLMAVSDAEVEGEWDCRL